MITLTSSTPVNGATNVPTGTNLSITIDSDAANINKKDIIVSVAGVLAINSQNFSDGIINNTGGLGTSIDIAGLLTVPDPIFSSLDVGKTVTITGSASNDGDHTITAYTSPTQVTLSGIVPPAEGSGFTWRLQSSSLFTSFSYNFKASDVGRFIYISNSTNPSNNVEATITSVLNDHVVRTSVSYTGGASPETNLSWTLYGNVNGFTATYTPTSTSNLTYLLNLSPSQQFLGSKVIPVFIYIGTTSLSFSFTTSARPRIASIDPVIGDPFGRNIRVYFTTSLMMSADVVNVAAYTLEAVVGSVPVPSIPFINSIVPENFVNPSYVDLKLSSPMTNQGHYTITVNKTGAFNLFSSSNGNKFDVPPDNIKDFRGFGSNTSYTLYKDTLVNTPIIEGPEFISFAPVKASLNYSPVGSQGGLVFTASNAGESGNSITVWLKHPGAANKPFVVDITGNAIVVFLATNSAGSVITRIQDVVHGLSDETNLVSVIGSGNLNSTVIPMATPQALSGGAKLDTTTHINFVRNSDSDPLLGSLDPDVVSILPGPSCSGVVSIKNFINSGDGSGSFDVVFSSFVTNYKLSVIVVDNVDNLSFESNILSLSVLPETLPGLEFSLVPYRGVYSDTCDRLLSDIPESLFVLKEGYTVPYTYDPYPFTLKVVDTGVPVYITVSRDSLVDKPETNIFTIIPQAQSEIIPLSLGRGRNYIFATDGIRTTQIVVAATTYSSILCSVSTEIFDYSRLGIQEIVDSVFNDLATRLAEPYLQLYSVLPSVKPQQLLSTKLAIRSYVSTAGQQQAVVDLVTAITLQTPFLKANTSDTTYFDPPVIPLFNTAESFAGTDIHVWLHNTCAARWIAFIKYLKNLPDVFRLLYVSDSEVEFIDDTGTVQRHQFDLLDSACSTLDVGNFCFDNVIVDVKSSIVSRINICAASYPFDLCLDDTHRLGVPGMFDTGFLWDLGYLMDNDESYLDPANDGWVGFCLTPRMDSTATLSTVPPRIFDPVLGSVVRNSTGTKIYGVGTSFSMYLLAGDTVYIKNENIPLIISSVDSDTELTLDSPYVAAAAPALSGTSATMSFIDTHTADVSGLGTLGSLDLFPGQHLVLFGPRLVTPILVDILTFNGSGACTVTCPVPINYTALPPSTPVYWTLGDSTALLKKLSGVPLDSTGDQPSDKMLGDVYILNNTMGPQQASLPEVPFYVTGINTNFTQDTEVGFTVYFPDNDAISYVVEEIESDTRIRIRKISPPNDVISATIIPPHSRVSPTASGSSDASLTRVSASVANFVCPQTIFTVPSIGQYINFPQKSGFGNSLNSVTGVLEVPYDTFIAADFPPGSTVVISGAITPANNGIKNVVAYIDPRHVQISGISLDEASNFMWTIDENSTTTNRRIARITALNGTAPTNSVQLVTLDGGSWVSGTETNTFEWELLPNTINMIQKTSPACAYESGYAVSLPTLTSTDINLSTLSAINADAFTISYQEDVTITNIDLVSAYVEISGLIPGPVTHRPFFLPTDVGFYLEIAGHGAPNKIIQYISPTKVIVDAGLSTIPPTNLWWYLRNT